MSVTVELPPDLEQRLRGETPDLESCAKEAMLVELYRKEKLTRCELGHALGLDRFETDALLKRHQVAIDLPTSDEIEEDLRYLRKLVRP
ncbi:MAG: hypothetical protein DCC68_12685 [Planctomycetota bacterium]|nr:MAG: hypothetical protein DCC68_12685 [Planctomycetota bacterium]